MSRLLVVDADSGRRLILRSRLSEGGHEIVLAENGARGLLEARDGAPFDAILVNARLTGGIDGQETCRRLKAAPGRNHVPVVIFDDDGTGAEEMARAYEAGCDAFVARSELPALEHVLRVLGRQRTLVEDLLAAASRSRDGGAAPEAPAAEPDKRPGADHAAALRELASGRPDGVLIVDAEGLVCHADRGACELLGGRVEGAHLGSLAPASGLEAHVRDARVDAREGLRFELPPRRGRPARSMVAVVVPMLLQPREDSPALRAVLLQDNQRRRTAADALRTHEPCLPRAEAGPLLEAAREVYTPASIVGPSAAAARLREEIAHAAGERGPVLLVGERGTGRRRVARILHYSGQMAGSFVEVRCGALSPKELEAEIFGVGRANGRADRPGLLHLAQDGTLYLDEVGELPPPLQERLLRFLDCASVERGGALRPERLVVRILASTSAVLRGAACEDRLLPALLERLSACEIAVPNLAQRAEDVEPLALAFVERFGAAAGVPGIDADALSVLRAHSWGGNVAELETCLEHALAQAQGRTIGVADLPRGLHGLHDRELIPHVPGASSRGATHAPAALPHHEMVPAPRGGLPARDPHPWDIQDDEPVSLELYEQKALLRAIAECNGDKLAAARLLKLGKSTLYRKLKRYGIK